jgi:putative hydrolase of the HAD superfamily
VADAVIDAVLFDWGGTLMSFAWSDEIALAGDRAGLAALGRDDMPTAEQLGEWFRASADGRERFDVAEEDELVLEDVIRACFVDHGCRLSDDDVRLFIEQSYAAWEPSLALASTTHALLETLRSWDLRLALVSNTAQPGWLLRPVLQRQGLTERLDAIVLSSEVGKRKPHRAIFERALGELGVAPERAVFVGDKLYEDVGGAAAAGMRTVQALWFFADERDDAAEPDFQAFTQMDVLSFIRRLDTSG